MWEGDARGLGALPLGREDWTEATVTHAAQDSQDGLGGNLSGQGRRRGRPQAQGVPCGSEPGGSGSPMGTGRVSITHGTGVSGRRRWVLTGPVFHNKTRGFRREPLERRDRVWGQPTEDTGTARLPLGGG